jgi:hypothetical protein
MLEDGFVNDDKHDESSKNILAPFVKLRWDFVELTYRGLCGIREVWINDGVREIHRGYSTIFQHTFHWENKGFGWNSHQLMLGLYLQRPRGERRSKVTPKRSAPPPPDWRNDPSFAPSP